MKNGKATKTRYSDEELKEFEEIIDKKLSKAKSQLDFYMSQLSDMADSSDAKIKGLDDGTGTAENERITTMAARQKKTYWSPRKC